MSVRIPATWRVWREMFEGGLGWDSERGFGVDILWVVFWIKV
jgi:hypothetical protein